MNYTRNPVIQKLESKSDAISKLLNDSYALKLLQQFYLLEEKFQCSCADTANTSDP